MKIANHVLKIMFDPPDSENNIFVKNFLSNLNLQATRNTTKNAILVPTLMDPIENQWIITCNSTKMEQIFVFDAFLMYWWSRNNIFEDFLGTLWSFIIGCVLKLHILVVFPWSCRCGLLKKIFEKIIYLASRGSNMTI